MFHMKAIVVYLFILVTVNNTIAESPIVLTSYGQVKGNTLFVAQSNSYVSVFQGIPYAKPPIGNLRFKRPETANKWSDILDATKARRPCIQRKMANISEDCLFINIYTPTKTFPDSSKRSVMFYIHGGTYLTGTIFDEEFNATYLSIRGDVVVVEVNYRLSLFGFLYDGTDEAPGNQAFYDYLLALEWVKENIANFGGDPNSVTIFGESAGAMAVGSLVLIKNQTLFRRAILQSGSPNSYIGTESSELAFDKAKQLAIAFDCYHNTTNKINISCLRSIEVESLNVYTDKRSYDGEFFIPIYGDNLFPVRPSLALQNGNFRQNIEILFGTCNDEGSGFVTEYVINLRPDSPPNSMTVALTKFVIQVVFSTLKLPYVTNITNFYTNNLTDSDGLALKHAVADSFGDFQITCPLILFGSAFALKNNQNKAYAYRLTYSPRNSSTDWTGVRHGDDISYVFGTPLRFPQKHTEDEINLSKTIIDVWSTFAKTGKPPSIENTSWPEAIDRGISNPHVRYMELNPNGYQIVENAYENSCEGFWRPYLTDSSWNQTKIFI